MPNRQKDLYAPNSVLLQVAESNLRTYDALFVADHDTAPQTDEKSIVRKCLLPGIVERRPNQNAIEVPLEPY